MRNVAFAALVSWIGMSLPADVQAWVAVMTQEDAQALTQQGVADPWRCVPVKINKDAQKEAQGGEAILKCWECNEGNHCSQSGAPATVPDALQKRKSIPRRWLEQGI